jgi:hypothetical protein
LAHFKKTIATVGLILAMGATAPAHAFSFSGFVDRVFSAVTRDAACCSGIDYTGPRWRPSGFAVRVDSGTNGAWRLPSQTEIGLEYARSHHLSIVPIPGKPGLPKAGWLIVDPKNPAKNHTLPGARWEARQLKDGQSYYNGKVQEHLGCGGSGTSC